MGKKRTALDDAVGETFGLLTVIGVVKQGRKGVVKARCRGSNLVDVRLDLLKSGNNRSCGKCVAKTVGRSKAAKNTAQRFRPTYNPPGKKNSLPGTSTERLYTLWNQMFARCYNPNHNRYHLYGGRGIEVDEAWLDYTDYREWATSNGYKRGLQLDRIDTDGNYGPDNCRWVTSKENNRNRRNNRMITYQGETRTLSEWAEDERCQVTYRILWERLQDGVSFENALLTPQRRKNGYRLITAWGEEKSLTEWAKDPRCSGVSRTTLWKRINDGWVPERAITTPVRV